MSLRLRLVAGLIVVAAAGLLALGGITYAEQRSFLYERVDDQTREAQDVAGRELHEQGFDVPGYGGGEGSRGPGSGRGGPRGGGGPRPGEALNVEPGTYGERRDASGKEIGHVFVNSLGTTDPARPELPAELPLGKLVTVDAEGDSGLRYRVLAHDTPHQPGTTVVAVPLSEVDRTLDRLLLVEGIVIARRAAGARRRRLGARAARPAPARPDGADGRRDRRRRPRPSRQPGDAEDRGRPARPRLEPDARAAGARVRPARGVREAAARVPVRRVARAAHPADLDPRLRRGDSDGRGGRRGRPRSRRWRGSRRRPRGWACWSRTC